MTKSAFLGVPEVIDRVYGAGRRAQVESITECRPGTVTAETIAACDPCLREIEVAFSTWGMPVLSADELERFPALRAVFYAAGTVQHFARPLLEKSIRVFSAWAANAVPVAEFTLAQILLANKGYFLNVREYRGAKGGGAFRGRGNYGATVALLGAGQIGRKVIELLKPFRLAVIVFDPFLSEQAARQLGVRKVSLAEAFAQGDVVSNHLANVPATAGMVNGPLLESMRPHAVFINTGRGATVAEEDLLRVLGARPDLTALLDVTVQEPLPSSSPLFSLPNVQVSSHIAGSLGDEVLRMADYMIEEFQAWQAGRPLRYAVTLEMLETMA